MRKVLIYKYYNVESGVSFVGMVKDACKFFEMSDFKFYKMLANGKILKTFDHEEVFDDSPCYVFYDCDGEWIFTGSKRGCAKELGMSQSTLMKRVKEGEFIITELGSEMSEKFFEQNRVKKEVESADRELTRKKYLYKSIFTTGI